MGKKYIVVDIGGIDGISFLFIIMKTCQFFAQF